MYSSANWQRKKTKNQLQSLRLRFLTSNGGATKGGFKNRHNVCLVSALSFWMICRLSPAPFPSDQRKRSGGARDESSRAPPKCNSTDLLAVYIRRLWSGDVNQPGGQRGLSRTPRAAWTHARSIITSCRVYAAQTIVGLPFLQPLKGYFVISEVGLFRVLVSITCIGHRRRWSGRYCTDGHNCLT